MLDFKEVNGRPTLLGFISADTLLVRWDKGMDAGLELWNVKTASPVGRGIVFTNISHDPSPGNRAISNNGKLYAFAGRIQRDAFLFVYDLTAGVQRRRIPIKSIGPGIAVQPSGIAFSGDDTKVAVLFEQQGNGLLTSWRVADGRQAVEHVFPAGVLPPQPPGGVRLRGEPVRALEWIGDGTAWLVYGQRAYDEETARLIGETAVPAAVDQRVIDDGTTVLIESARDGGSTTLYRLDLDKAKLTPKRNAAAGAGMAP
jgi:hypothetical protein